MLPSLNACASAPGKVILFGEHAVVFGEPAVAAALSDLRITVKVALTSTKQIRIRMPDLPTPIDVLFSALELRLHNLHEPPTKYDADVIQKRILAQRPAMHDLTVSALVPLVYLMNQLGPSHLFETGLDVQVRSQDLPVGAGLGSSAAFGVACAASFLRLNLLHEHSSVSSSSAQEQPPPLPPLGRPNDEQLEIINTYSFYSEILLHGTPSGIDNAVSTFGGAIDYTKAKDGSTTTMEKFDMPHLDMIIANTHVPRSTKLLVAHVRKLYEQHPNVVASILNCMGSIARDFRRLDSSHCMPNANPVTRSTNGHLLTLVRTNQHMLGALGVSHPSLDHICALVDHVSEGAAAAKLTGAGGGGCAMIVVLGEGHASRAMARKIQHALEMKKHSWNYSCLQSSVGKDGVLWLDSDAFPETERKHQRTGFATEVIIAFAAVGTGLLAVALMRKR
jgi:mevalonate kinase